MRQIPGLTLHHYPDCFAVTVLKVQLRPEFQAKNNLTNFVQIRFRKELIKVHIEEGKISGPAVFDLDAHKLLFDSFKVRNAPRKEARSFLTFVRQQKQVYVYETSLILKNPRQLAKAKVRLSALTHFQDDFEE